MKMYRLVSGSRSGNYPYLGGAIEQYKRATDEVARMKIGLNPAITRIVDEQLLPEIRKALTTDANFGYEIRFNAETGNVSVAFVDATVLARPATIDELRIWNEQLAPLYSRIGKEYGLPISGFIQTLQRNGRVKTRLERILRLH